MNQVTFSFDETAVYSGLTDGSTWNGFINVWVSPEVREQIVADFIADGCDPDDFDDMLAIPVENGLVSLANGYATVEA